MDHSLAAQVDQSEPAADTPRLRRDSTVESRRIARQRNRTAVETLRRAVQGGPTGQAYGSLSFRPTAIGSLLSNPSTPVVESLNSTPMLSGPSSLNVHKAFTI